MKTAYCGICSMESVYAALMSDFYSLAPLKQELLFKVSLGSFFTYSYAYLLFRTKSGRKTICNTYVQKKVREILPNI